MVGTGFKLGPLRVGIGYVGTKYTGGLDLNTQVGIKLDSLIGWVDTLVSTESDSWFVHVDVGIDSLVVDSVVSSHLSGQIDGVQHGIVVGAQLRFGLVDLGVTVEKNFPFVISGAGGWDLSYISVPDTIEIDTTNSNLSQIPGDPDTLRGNINVDILHFTYGDTGITVSDRVWMCEKVGIRGGFLANLIIFKLGVAGGIDIPQPSLINLYNAFASVLVDFDYIRLGVASEWKWLGIGQTTVPFPPMVVGGLAGGTDIGPVRFDIALRMNLYTGFAEVGGYLRNLKAQISPWSTLVVGGGLRFRFGS